MAAGIDQLYTDYIEAHNNYIEYRDTLDYVRAGDYYTEAKKIKNRIILKELHKRGFKYDFITELFIEAE